MAKTHRERGGPIRWERARGIFGNPRPLRLVWERQFDYLDDELRRLAATPYERMDLADLWYYYHDLAYVELQPELFDYLFPACLMDWHFTLMSNYSCSHGDSEFHYGLHQGNVLARMTTPEQREAIYEFFRDSFLERLDAERGFDSFGMGMPCYGWMPRFNSVGLIMPRIELLWNPWWSLDTPGRAVAVLQYCSGLMYFEGENPLFERCRQEYGSDPYLWEDDSFIYHDGWMPENLDFLARTLTPDFVEDRVINAVARLRGVPECEKAQRLESDLPERLELVTSRVADLPSLLGKSAEVRDWTV